MRGIWPVPGGIRYRWVVLFMAFLALLAAQGVRVSFQAFVRPWQEAFAADRAAITLVAGVSILIYGLGQPLAGRLADRYGARVLMSFSLLVVGLGLLASRQVTNATALLLTYGFLTALGFAGTSPVAATALVGQWFPESRGLAMSLIVVGFAVAVLVVSPLAVLLVRSWGWADTLLAYGVVIAILALLVGAFLRSGPPARAGDVPSPTVTVASAAAAPVAVAALAPAAGAPPLSAMAVLGRRVFWLLALPFFFCGFTTLGFINTHLVPLAEDRQVAAATIASALAVTGVGEVIGVLCAGWLTDRWGRRQTLLLLYGLRAGAYALLLFAGSSPGWLLVFAAVYGFSELATISPTGALCGDLFGLRSVGMTFGWVAMGHQVGAALGAYLPGVLFDLTGTYVPTLVGGGILLLGAIALTLALPGTRPQAAASGRAAG